jgi:hypothetical protein
VLLDNEGGRDEGGMDDSGVSDPKLVSDLLRGLEYEAGDVEIGTGEGVDVKSYTNHTLNNL